nr:MAG TPA: hypothetical protein [Caudoviricetes sp.]
MVNSSRYTPSPRFPKVLCESLAFIKTPQPGKILFPSFFPS